LISSLGCNSKRQEVASMRRKKPGDESCIQLFQYLSRKYFHKVKDHGHEEMSGIFSIERELTMMKDRASQT